MILFSPVQQTKIIHNLFTKKIILKTHFKFFSAVFLNLNPVPRCLNQTMYLTAPSYYLSLAYCLGKVPMADPVVNNDSSSLVFITWINSLVSICSELILIVSLLSSQFFGFVFFTVLNITASNVWQRNFH